MNTHLFTPTSCKRPLACLLAALFFAAAPARAQVLPYADDFKNQTDYLLIRDYYNLGEQIGAEHWPSLDFEVEDIVIGRNSTNDTYAWAYLTSRICVFVVGVDYFEYNDNEMWVFVLFSLEPIDLNAIRSGNKKIKDFKWTIGSGAHFFDWYMGDLRIWPSDFRLDRPIAQAYKDLGNRPWSNGSNDEWENVVAWGIHKTLSDPLNAILNGVYWTNDTPKDAYHYGGLWESYYGGDEVNLTSLHYKRQGPFSAHSNDDLYFQMSYFRPSGPVGWPRRSFQGTNTFNGTPIDYYNFRRSIPPPSLHTTPSHLNTVTLPVLQMTPFTVDGASYDAEPFSLTGLPLTFQISPDHHLFFQQGWHSATLMSRYPGDFTLTASANVKGLIDPIRTPSSDTVSDTWHIHTPVPPAHITSTPSTHTIIWETADVNFPAYTARLLPEEPISLRYKLTSQLSIQSFMKFFRTPHQEIPDNLAEEDIPLSKFGGGTWTSSDNSVVAVTQDGLLTAHKTGEATISFTTAGPITDYPYPIDPFTITQKVTVPPAVASSLKLAWKSGTVQAQSGDAVTLHTLYYDNQVFPTTLQALFPIDILPEYKDLITPNDYTVVLTWTSSNPEVASVSSTGFVTALSPGITTIKVSAQVTPSELCEPQSSYFVVKVPQLPVLKWEQGEGTEEVMTVHLSKLLPQPVLKTTTIQYAGMSYSLLGMRWTTSDERVVQVRWDANNRSEARLEAIGEGEATITFEADGLPYSGYSEHKEFTLTQRVHVPKLPQRQVKSTLTDVNKTEVEYIPVGASLAFPYKVEYTYEGKAYPLVNEVWTTSNAEVVDVWKSTTGWRLFAQTEGEAILKFHAEGGAYGFETFEFERRVSIVSMLPEGNEETPGGDEEIPGGDEEIPGGDEEIPGGDEEIPGGDEEIPGGDEEIPGGDEEIPGGDEEIPGEVTGAVSIRWNDDGEDKVMKVGERFKLGLWLIMDGETYPYPNGGAEWLSSNEGVVSVRWGEVEALKTGFATVYAHVKIGERAAVVSRYIAVPRQGSLYEVHDGIVPITSSDDTPQYYTLTGKYIGNQTPEKVGVYLQKIGEAMIKVIVH